MVRVESTEDNNLLPSGLHPAEIAWNNNDIKPTMYGCHAGRAIRRFHRGLPPRGSFPIGGHFSVLLIVRTPGTRRGQPLTRWGRGYLATGTPRRSTVPRTPCSWRRGMRGSGRYDDDSQATTCIELESRDVSAFSRCLKMMFGPLKSLPLSSYG